MAAAESSPSPPHPAPGQTPPGEGRAGAESASEPQAQSTELETWQPHRGRAYRFFAWLIIGFFALTLLATILAVLISSFGLYRVS